MFFVFRFMRFWGSGFLMGSLIIIPKKSQERIYKYKYTHVGKQLPQNKVFMHALELGHFQTEAQQKTA